MSTPTGQTVGFLGMGIMGEAMARNLLKSGLFKAVYVWNRSADKVDAGTALRWRARHAILGSGLALLVCMGVLTGARMNTHVRHASMAM